MNKPLLPLIFIFTLIGLTACSDDTPVDKQTKLLETLQRMESEIENKNLDAFFSHVSDDFKSEGRGWTKQDAERLLRLRLMRNKTVHVHQAVRDINWLNDGEQQVEVKVVAAMAGTDFSLTDLPTLRGDMVKFNVTFQLIDDRYQITQSEWQRATPADFVF